ncbi:MAG: DUF423 domain-containing protein [Chloroflexi bacterium]|nr:DUF423 domain-containing protein [Chloroflexota bacterium]
MDRLFLGLGATFALTGVAAGAFGAHALRGALSEPALATFETGVRYQMYHALALLAVAFLAGRQDAGLAAPVGWLFVAGILLFSGSLYLLALTEARFFGAVTPLGGLCFLAGWLLLVVAALRSG